MTTGSILDACAILAAASSVADVPHLRAVERYQYRYPRREGQASAGPTPHQAILEGLPDQVGATLLTDLDLGERGRDLMPD